MKTRTEFLPGFTAWREAFFWFLELEGAGEDLPCQGRETQYLPDEHVYASKSQNEERVDLDSAPRISQDRKS